MVRMNNYLNVFVHIDVDNIKLIMAICYYFLVKLSKKKLLLLLMINDCNVVFFYYFYIYDL